LQNYFGLQRNANKTTSGVTHDIALRKVPKNTTSRDVRKISQW